MFGNNSNISFIKMSIPRFPISSSVYILRILPQRHIKSVIIFCDRLNVFRLSDKKLRPEIAF